MDDTDIPCSENCGNRHSGKGNEGAREKKNACICVLRLTRDPGEDSGGHVCEGRRTTVRNISRSRSSVHMYVPSVFNHLKVSSS